MIDTGTDTQLQDTANEVSEEEQAKIEQRTAVFMDLFTKMESEGIDLEGPEAKSIARTATSELGIQQKVNDLSDIKVEDLSDYEFKRIISRARTTIKRVIELRTKFSPIMKTVTKPDGTTDRVATGRRAGPYYSNRKSKRDKNPERKRASLRSCFASKVVAEIKERNSMTTPPGM